MDEVPAPTAQPSASELLMEATADGGLGQKNAEARAPRQHSTQGATDGGLGQKNVQRGRAVLALVVGLLAVLMWTPGATAATATSAAAAVPAVVSAAGETFEQVAADPELTDDHARVFRLYWAFFGRSPDPEGARYWIAQRDRCATLTTIADSFAASPELAARYGPLDNAAFVEQVYLNVLARPGDPGGLAYWGGELAAGRLSRGGVVLYVSLSAELTARHPYPSDGVHPRSCLTPDGRPTGRAVDILAGSPPPGLVTVAGLTLMAPASVIERAGFHQSSHPGAQEMAAAIPGPVRLTTLSSRERGTNERGAVDVVVEPSTRITAPIAGTVKRAGTYTLYCRYQDSYVVIAPDSRPELEVKILHLRDLAVKAGQKVKAGDKVAARANKFPFTSQVDELTAAATAWPHVHLEVVDPSVPRPPGGGC